MAKVLAQTPASSTRRAIPSPRFGLPYLLSSLLAFAALVASAAGFLITDLFQQDNPALGGNARGTALVILVIAVPALVIAMILAKRGSLRARLVWLGVLTYIFYNSFYFTFSATFHRFFLAFLLMLSLAGWALLTTLMDTDARRVKEAFAPKTPVLIPIMFLLLPVLIFLMVDLREILIATVSNNLPPSILDTQMPTNHFHVLDLAFLVPAFLLSAAWLWQRRAWGYTLAGMLLTFYTIELFGIGIDQHYGGTAAPTSPLTDASALPIFVVMSVFWLSALMFFIRNLHSKAQ